MGQYHIPVNLAKREFIHPHKLGAGLKLIEQLSASPGIAGALIVLTAVSNGRGGGDFDNGVRYHYAQEDYTTTVDEAVARQSEVIGRWGGDAIAIVGDYAVIDDLPAEYNADLIWTLCLSTLDDLHIQIERARERGENEYADRLEEELETKGQYKDVTDLVVPVLEHELGGEFTGTGWRKFTYSNT